MTRTIHTASRTGSSIRFDNGPSDRRLHRTDIGSVVQYEGALYKVTRSHAWDAVASLMAPADADRYRSVEARRQTQREATDAAFDAALTECVGCEGDFYNPDGDRTLCYNCG